MAVNDLTNQNIQDTYQRVIQTDGINTADGTGSLLPISFDGNNVIISGSLVAHSYVVSESITAVSSGSTRFGNSIDDTHIITGSLNNKGSITSSNYNIFGISDMFPINFARMVGNAVTLGSNNPSYPTHISGSTLRIHSSADTIFDLGGGDFRINNAAQSEYFRFNLETNPVIETTGDLTIDPTGGNTKFDSHITASGEISASGIIYGGAFTSVGRMIGTADSTRVTLGSADFPTFIQGNITGSGNISASGHIIASRIYGNADGAFITTANGQIQSSTGFAGTNITASGNISASGTIIGGTISGSAISIASASSHIEAMSFLTTPVIGFTVGNTNTDTYYRASDKHHYLSGRAVFGGSDLFTSAQLAVHGNIATSTHVTASGNISSSGNIIGTIDGGKF